MDVVFAKLKDSDEGLGEEQLSARLGMPQADLMAAINGLLTTGRIKVLGAETDEKKILFQVAEDSHVLKQEKCALDTPAQHAWRHACACVPEPCVDKQR